VADATCPAAWLTPPAVDAAIALPPDGGALLLHAAAKGTQNYVCSAADAGASFAWTLRGPEATLADCNGRALGEHSAPTAATAPEWRSADGSAVVGRKVAANAHDASAIPWLLLSVASHRGSGVLSRAKYVQRLTTVGGLAPTAPCTAQNAGATQDVAYTADYYFFGE
jgi:hypothetical protein